MEPWKIVKINRKSVILQFYNEVSKLHERKRVESHKIYSDEKIRIGLVLWDDSTPEELLTMEWLRKEQAKNPNWAEEKRQAWLESLKK